MPTYRVRYEVEVEADDPLDAKITAGYELAAEGDGHETYIVEVVEVTDDDRREP